MVLIRALGRRSGGWLDRGILLSWGWLLGGLLCGIFRWLLGGLF